MRRALALMHFACLCVLGGCDLEEITIVEFEDVVIAEIYVNLVADPAENEIRAFLHRSLGGSGMDQPTDARIVVTRSDGFRLTLSGYPLEACLESFDDEESGACFFADSAQAATLRPGDVFDVVVTLANGGVIEGSARAPAAFEIEEVPATCRLDPDTLMPIRWSSSEGAWAYVNETSISGLPEALAPEGIVVEDDPLVLLGLSISDQDTTVVFPSEFGVFDRFDLDQELSVRLQSGIPASTTAEVAITAVDANWVNWARGGNFNPSGQVRVPSLRGDGTGVFGATVGRRFFVVSSSDRGAAPDCPVTVQTG